MTAGDGPPAPLVDFHVHLLGTGDGGTGCSVAPSVREGPLFHWLIHLLGLKGRRRTLDEAYLCALEDHLAGSPIGLALLYAQDGRYDRRGALDRERTQLYCPNDYCLRVARERPGRFAACASINPKRRDALEELEKCAALGAVAVKIHPPIQHVDPGDRRFRPFYRRVAELDLLAIVHTGHEHSTRIAHQSYGDPRRLATLLDEGCTVVAAHSGTCGVMDQEDFFPHYLAMLERYPRLYGDTAVLASVFRWPSIPRLLARPDAVARTLHGSDFPLPSNPLVFAPRIGVRRAWRLLGEKSLIARDFALKRALGVPEATSRLAYELLRPRLARARGRVVS